MNAVTTTDEQPVSAATLEHVLGTGDLSKLSTAQRVEYYRRTCETIGVNPLTRPFRFMSLNGQTVLYATRDLTDQLRQLHKVKISIVDKAIEDDLFVVTARATLPDGRQDEDVGAVTIGHLRGDARANAVMKALTKAKRRVTLSICGLGFTDEAELETIQGVQTYDAEETPPPAPLTRREQINRDVPLTPAPRRTVGQFLEEINDKFRGCNSQAEVTALSGSDEVQTALKMFKDTPKAQLDDIIAEAVHRFSPKEPPPKPDDFDETWPGPRPEDIRKEREAEQMRREREAAVV